MAETTLLGETIEAFDDARGDRMDGVWASGVTWSLLMRDVDSDQVREGLEEALALVRETQEPARDLFGTPTEHADALWARWHDDGMLVLTGPETPSWQGALRLGLGMSAAYGALFALVLLLRGDLGDGAPLGRILLVSLALGMGTTLGLALWGRRHRRRPAGPDAPEDVHWSLELTEILRTRYSLSGPRVRDIVAEAHAHAAESGRPVLEEFGTPTAYAARFAPDLRRRSRLTIAFFALLIGAVVLQMVDGVRWTHVAMIACFTWLGWSEVRRLRNLRPS
ncbi:hypothetical protein Pve01_91280 [Planomonospora venezuelensis]|nr:hypothetical protein Pve01_91280 [Planomonospora venezuelensis]